MYAPAAGGDSMTAGTLRIGQLGLQKQQIQALLNPFSFVVLLLKGVRGWKPPQPELCQEMQDPGPGPLFLALCHRSL